MTAPKSPGRMAYEADRQARPAYFDGVPRPPWSAISDAVRKSWDRRHPQPLKDTP